MLYTDVKHTFLEPIYALHMESMGDRIRKTRENMEASQTVLGDTCGVTRQAISQWEDDTTIPTGPNLVTAALFLRKSPEWLVTGAETRILYFEADDTDIINGFRQLDPDGRSMLLKLIGRMSPENNDTEAGESLKKATP